MLSAMWCLGRVALAGGGGERVGARWIDYPHLAVWRDRA